MLYCFSLTKKRKSVGEANCPTQSQPKTFKLVANCAAFLFIAAGKVKFGPAEDGLLGLVFTSKKFFSQLVRVAADARRTKTYLLRYFFMIKRIHLM